MSALTDVLELTVKLSSPGGTECGIRYEGAQEWRMRKCVVDGWLVDGWLVDGWLVDGWLVVERSCQSRLLAGPVSRSGRPEVRKPDRGQNGW